MSEPAPSIARPASATANMPRRRSGCSARSASAAGGWPEPQVSTHLTVGGAIGQLGRADFAAAERRERAILRL